MASEAQPNTRERRFKKIFLDADGAALDHDEISDAKALGIEIDGKVLSVDIDDFDEATLKRLVFDSVYDKLTRAVHSAKPAADTREAAVSVIQAAYVKIQAGDFKRASREGGREPRVFDPTRFIFAIKATAKALGRTIPEHKLTARVNELAEMRSEDRQKFLNKNYMKDPFFREAWNKFILDQKKAEAKKTHARSVLDSFEDEAENLAA